MDSACSRESCEWHVVLWCSLKCVYTRVHHPQTSTDWSLMSHKVIDNRLTKQIIPNTAQFKNHLTYQCNKIGSAVEYSVNDNCYILWICSDTVRLKIVKHLRNDKQQWLLFVTQRNSFFISLDVATIPLYHNLTGDIINAVIITSIPHSVGIKRCTKPLIVCDQKAKQF